MADAVASPVVDKAAEKAAKEAKKAADKAAREASKQTANGVTRPKSGTMTGRIWDISDEVSRVAGKAAERKDVIARALAENLNEATAATQYGRWRKYHGLKAEPKAPPAKAPTSSDVSTGTSPA